MKFVGMRQGQIERKIGKRSHAGEGDSARDSNSLESKILQLQARIQISSNAERRDRVEVENAQEIRTHSREGEIEREKRSSGDANSLERRRERLGDDLNSLKCERERSSRRRNRAGDSNSLECRKERSSDNSNSLECGRERSNRRFEFARTRERVIARKIQIRSNAEACDCERIFKIARIRRG